MSDSSNGCTAEASETPLDHVLSTPFSDTQAMPLLNFTTFWSSLLELSLLPLRPFYGQPRSLPIETGNLCTWILAQEWDSS